jgi:lipoprotein-releasing system permease protein
MIAFQLASRFLFSPKKETFISINTILSIGAVALSVLVLIVVIAVMTGFSTMLREKIMTMAPHLVVHTESTLQDSDTLTSLILKNQEVLSASPYIQGFAGLEYEDRFYGIAIRSFVAPHDFQVLGLRDALKTGKAIPGSSEIIIGTELAQSLGVGLGGKLTVLGPAGLEDKEGNFPDEIEFTIVGIYESGLHEYDQTQTFVSLSDAKQLYGFIDAVHGIGVAVKNPESAFLVKKSLQMALPVGLSVRTWLENNKVFFSALRTEKNVMFILLMLTILIASLNIVSTLVMLVMEKVKDIGILKAIGFSQFSILRIFLFQGILIGAAGTLLGTLAGIVFVQNIDTLEQGLARWTGFEVFPSDVYYFDHIPTELHSETLLLIMTLSFLLALFASVYPAFRASRFSAMEALRYE